MNSGVQRNEVVTHLSPRLQVPGCISRGHHLCAAPSNGAMCAAHVASDGLPTARVTPVSSQRTGCIRADCTACLTLDFA